MNFRIFILFAIFIQSFALLSKNLIDEIFGINFPILDLGNAQGYTGYIDFISLDKMTSSIMKGTDIHNRPFIAIRAQILNKDGTKEQFFETFFQRYSDDTNLWQGCGKKQFMSTTGGMSVKQLIFLKDLLNQKKINLNENMIIDLHLFSYTNDIDGIKSIEII